MSLHIKESKRKQNEDSTGKTWKYLKGIFRSKHQKGKQTTNTLNDCATFYSSLGEKKSEHAVVLKKKEIPVSLFGFSASTSL